MKDWCSVFRHARSSVRHDSLSLCASDLWAQVGLVALTVDTINSLAFGSVAWNNNISDGNRGDIGTNGFNDGSRFMSGNTEIEIIDTSVIKIEKVCDATCAVYCKVNKISTIFR